MKKPNPKDKRAPSTGKPRIHNGAPEHPEARHGNAARRKEGETLTLVHPGSPLEIDHSAYTDEEADRSGSPAVNDKWWMIFFLVHTLAYLGISAWINYAAITNDKLPITEDTSGPIDT